MISAKELEFKYSKHGNLVLNKLNFECKQGTINVLIGLNGSGKTTLIKLLAGLLKPNSGIIEFQGIDLFEMTIKERSKLIAYVSQKSNFLDDFVVKDYLLFGMVNSMSFYQSPNEQSEKNAELYAEKLGVTHLLNKKLGELSGGERQIVSVCCSLIQNTPFILLDEPTSFLDIKNQHRILSVLKAIARNENKTIVLSSHNPNHALFLNSQVFLLKEGKIIQQGKAEDIITIEKLRPIYGDKICLSRNIDYNEISFKD